MGLAVCWTALSACAVFSLAAWGPPCDALDAPAFLERGLLFALIAAAALVDARWRVIPNAVPLAMVLLHAAFVAVYALAKGANLIVLTLGALVGALAVGGGLLAFTLVFETIRGAEGEAMGGGDIKLVAALGFALGCRQAAAALALACAVFALYAVCLSLRSRILGRAADAAHPFAPAVAAATYLVFLTCPGTG